MLRNKPESTRRWLELAPGDNVIVIAGKDKGKQGEVLRTLPDAHKIVVKGVNILKRHTKAGARRGGTQVAQGGIVDFEAPLDYGNVMQVPRLNKIVVNVGIGEAKDNDKALDAAVGDVTTITGQKPQLIKARKSVAAFKLREGQTIGIKTTLRGRRMWYFLDKLLNVALPRIRDFRGVTPDGFDGRGNYTLGLREQVVFPEVDYDKIDKLRGLEVSIITTARNDDEARSLLTRLGMPFRKR